MIIEVETGLLVKVPNDIKRPIISNWSDGTTTLEFYSSTYEMEYDSYEYTIDDDGTIKTPKQPMKEITLPKQGEYKIKKRIPKKFLSLIDDDKWFLLINI